MSLRYSHAGIEIGAYVNIQIRSVFILRKSIIFLDIDKLIVLCTKDMLI